MVTHISLYKVNGDPKTPEGQEAVAKLEALLNEVPGKLSDITSSSVGHNVLYPPFPMDAVYDVAQIITFDTMEQAAAYPASKAHGDLVEGSKDIVATVAFIDF